MQAFAIAGNVSGVNISTETYSYAPGLTHIYTAAPGNISVVNLTTNATTTRFEAFTGNITSNTLLANSAGTSIYEWFDAAVTGEVYMTIATFVPQFNVLANSTLGNLTNIHNGNWSYSNASDVANRTYTSVDIFTVGASNHETFSVITTAPFRTGVLTGATNTPGQTFCSWGCKEDYVFVTNISAGTAGYSGINVDYEMMVPSAADDTWYMYIELS